MAAGCRPPFANLQKTQFSHNADERKNSLRANLLQILLGMHLFSDFEVFLAILELFSANLVWAWFGCVRALFGHVRACSGVFGRVGRVRVDSWVFGHCSGTVRARSGVFGRCSGAVRALFGHVRAWFCAETYEFLVFLTFARHFREGIVIFDGKTFFFLFFYRKSKNL